jgi:hypothetical protein
LCPRQFSHSLPPPFLPGPKLMATTAVAMVPPAEDIEAAAITRAGAAAAAKPMSRLLRRPAAASMLRRPAVATVAVGTVAAIMAPVMTAATAAVMAAVTTVISFADQKAGCPPLTPKEAIPL